MLDTKKINELVRNVLDSLPDGVKNVTKDCEKNLKGALQGVFTKLDLVTREEFDAQTQVLLKTRKKLELLEQKVKLLEKEQ